MKKLTHDEFIKKVPKSFLNRFVFLSEYNGDANLIKLLDYDGRIYLSRPTHIKYGKIPRKSSALNKDDVFLIDANLLNDGIYEYDLSNYTKGSSKIGIRLRKFST